MNNGYNARRVGDIDSDHPDMNVTGSPNVITNHKPQVRVDDVDSDGPDIMVTGSGTVITNGKPTCRLRDSDNDGDIGVTGSPNVFIGDGNFPLTVVKEPGVKLIGGNTVYDDTQPGLSAQHRDEVSVSPTMPGHPEEPAAAPAIPAPKIASCGSFNDPLSEADLEKKISVHFKLSHIHKAVEAQLGLTAAQIACNWVALCNNILDPAYDAFPFNISSGFRSLAYNRSIGSKDTSDHCRGFAADLQCKNMSQTKALFNWLLHSGLPYSQLIFENTWVHVAYGGKVHNDIYKVAYLSGGIHPGGLNGELLPASILS